MSLRTLAASRLLPACLKLGGFVTLFIGAAHLLFPNYGYPREVVQSLESPMREHFYYLATYAIAGFLLTLGSISIYFSNMRDSASSLFVGVMLSILWWFRVALEFLWPCEVPIFVLKTPTTVITPALCGLALLYTLGVICSFLHRGHGHEPTTESKLSG